MLRDSSLLLLNRRRDGSQISINMTIDTFRDPLRHPIICAYYMDVGGCFHLNPLTASTTRRDVLRIIYDRVYIVLASPYSTFLDLLEMYQRRLL